MNFFGITNENSIMVLYINYSIKFHKMISIINHSVIKKKREKKIT